MSNINEKFGNDLEVVSVSRGSISIIYKNSTWFENKYNVSGKSDAEFLKDIADEWFECFRDEISAELEKEDTYFRWPVVISFKLEPGNEYEMLTFRLALMNALCCVMKNINLSVLYFLRIYLKM